MSRPRLFANFLLAACAVGGVLAQSSSASATPTATATQSPFRIHLSSAAVIALAVCITVGVIFIVIASYLCCCSPGAQRRAARARQLQAQNKAQCACQHQPGDVETGTAAPGYDHRSSTSKFADGGARSMDYRSSIAKDLSADVGMYAYGGPRSTHDDEVRSTTTKSDSPPRYEDS
ncbi:hypothetical protein C8F01DRAFT_1130879 [Mycena amicta]|nr:hypothetical protein C8F01DRAFT_1130879 [Mycena amicta]